MKNFYSNTLLLFLLLLVIACNMHAKDLSKQSTTEIINADIDMSNMAAKDGFYKALLNYADDSVVKTQEGTLPVIGKVSLQKIWSAKQDINFITWKPFKAEASAAGDLGYTIGNWKYAGHDTTMYGNYCTFWKKQPDGKWKFVFDGGNNTPAPAE